MALALRSDVGEAVAETESGGREQKGAAARVLPFPYARLVRVNVEMDRVPAARNLLQAGLQQANPDPALLTWRLLLAPAKVRVVPAKGVDRRAEIAWLSAHASEYRGQWVAVVGSHLVASAKSAQELNALLEEAAPSPPPLLFRFSD